MSTEKERIASIRADYLVRAAAMRKEGWTVTDNDDFETLTVQSPVDHDYYEFKYDERDRLKADNPDWLELDLEDYILASAVDW